MLNISLDKYYENSWFARVCMCVKQPGIELQAFWLLDDLV